MEAISKRNLNKFIIRLLVICVLANWTVLGLYFWKFAPGHWFELSSSQEVWAHFGDFYTGLLSPFLGFLAFIGILFTVVLQSKQLDLAHKLAADTKAQADVEEIQRLVANLSATIDAALARAPTFYAAMHVQYMRQRAAKSA